MGTTGALGMAEMVKEGLTDLDNALEWHILGNHYPPPPASMIGVCKRAIMYANKNKWDVRVRLPKGISCRGKRTASVCSIVDSFHLGFFLDEVDNDFYEDNVFD